MKTRMFNVLAIVLSCCWYQVEAQNILQTWGMNSNGQLGDPLVSYSLYPMTIGSSITWSLLDCGWTHTVAIQSDGSMWGWGTNGSGQLGDGTTTQRNAPVQIGGNSNDWEKISCGYNYSEAIKTDGSLWAFGTNGSGQLGDGSGWWKSSPVRVGASYAWESVSCGGNHTAAIQTNGTLWAWGHNSAYGQAGQGTSTWRYMTPVRIGTGTNWRMVSCGFYHSAAITDEGELWTWGANSYGQLGDGTSTTRRSPVQIGGSQDVWVFVACGQYQSLAIKDDGTLWAWGANSSGQLGDGSTTTRYSPVQIGTAATWVNVCSGNNHSMGIRSDGSLWAWGNNSATLGIGTWISSTTPVCVTSIESCAGISCGSSYTASITSVLCGQNQQKYSLCFHGHTLCISIPALPALLAQGATIGPCGIAKNGRENFAVAGEVILAQNFPNPFNPSTTIEFVIPDEGMVRLSVFDLFGREVDVLMHERKLPGYHVAEFNGSEYPTGMYVYRLEWNDTVISRRMTLLK